MNTRRWRRVGCLLVTVACLGLFVQSRKVPPHGDSPLPADVAVREQQTVGLRFSPWAEYYQGRRTVYSGNDTHDTPVEEVRIRWVSASWLLLAGAVGGLVGFRRLRKGKIVEDDDAW